MWEIILQKQLKNHFKWKQKIFSQKEKQVYKMEQNKEGNNIASCLVNVCDCEPIIYFIIVDRMALVDA